MAARGSLQEPGSASQDSPRPTWSEQALDTVVVVVGKADVSSDDVDIGVGERNVGVDVAVVVVVAVVSTVVGPSAVAARDWATDKKRCGCMRVYTGVFRVHTHTRTLTQTRTHARTHARTDARTHTHTAIRFPLKKKKKKVYMN